MNQLTDVTRPGLMISQTWPNSRERPGRTLEVIELTLKGEFFQALQTVEIPYADERRRVAGLLEAERLPLTYCITRVLNENGLNLSDLDEGNRRKSYEKAIRCLDDAREAGAVGMSFVSGAAPPDPRKRAEALVQLTDSLVHICRAARAEPVLKIVIEPLDFEAHKKATLGSIKEAIGICQAVEQEGLDLWLCLDMAHMLLNGEDPVESLAVAKAYVAEFHFCNCVLDPSHQLFGDWHLPFGPPGVVDVDSIANIMQRLVAINFFNTTDRPLIFCEVLKREQDESLAVMQHCRDTLQQAWNSYLQTSQKQEK
jgi:sugar phosphate isomerase/epimerase